MLAFERRERQLLRELRHSAKRRRAKATLRRLQAKEIEDEEATERRGHGQPVLRCLLRRVLRPELAAAVDLLIPRAPPRDVVQSVTILSAYVGSSNLIILLVSNFGELVLLCIDSYDSEKRRILQR